MSTPRTPRSAELKGGPGSLRRTHSRSNLDNSVRIESPRRGKLTPRDHHVKNGHTHKSVRKDASSSTKSDSSHVSRPNVIRRRKKKPPAAVPMDPGDNAKRDAVMRGPPPSVTALMTLKRGTDIGNGRTAPQHALIQTFKNRGDVARIRSSTLAGVGSAEIKVKSFESMAQRNGEEYEYGWSDDSAFVNEFTDDSIVDSVMNPDLHDSALFDTLPCPHCHAGVPRGGLGFCTSCGYLLPDGFEEEFFKHQSDPDNVANDNDDVLEDLSALEDLVAEASAMLDDIDF